VYEDESGICALVVVPNVVDADLGQFGWLGAPQTKEERSPEVIGII